MSSRSLRSRRPLTLLARITLVALFVNALAYASELIRLGPFDPEVSTIVVLLLVATAFVATGWWWAPALGGLLAGVIIVNNPFLLINLSDPGAGLFFVATVAEATSGITALLAGIAATVQNYRTRRTAKSDAENPNPQRRLRCC
jgi:hypothetical protein